MVCRIYSGFGMFASQTYRRVAPVAGGIVSVSLALDFVSKNTSTRVASSTATCAIRHLQQRALASRASVWTSTSRNPFSSLLVGHRSVVTTSESKTLFQRYEAHLEARPVVTKMFTGMCLWSIGDAVAQLVPPMAGQVPPLQQYDWARTSRAAFFGFAIHAPTSHVHFNFLEWMTVRLGVTGLKIPLFKAFMEQFVYWSWISNSMYHGAMGFMQGMNGQQVYDRIADVLWETQKVGSSMIYCVD